MSTKKKQPSPARDWCFTVNNPSPEDFAALKNMDYKYIVFQLEAGENGTQHFQGFVQLEDKQRLTALKKVCKRAHWEKRRGTPYEAAHYCKKPVPDCDEPHKWGRCSELTRYDEEREFDFEDGIISHGDNAAKIETVARVIQAKGLSHTIQRFPGMYIQYYRGMEKLAQFFTPTRDWKTQITILWGEPGSGKTEYGMRGFPSPYKLAVKGFENGPVFFGDYRPDEHQTVVVDDFYSSWRFGDWLQICDQYPTEVHTKGGFVQLLARDIVFTSNHGPSVWYPQVLADPERRDSFYRRVENIIHFTKHGYVVEKVINYLSI